MRRAGAIVALALAGLTAPAAGAATCGERRVPAPPAAPASVEAVDGYLRRLDRASARVRTGVAGRSVEGRPLRYAIVGAPGAIRSAALERTAGPLRAVRDGARRRLPAGQRAIAWLAAGVHGNERSGVDADLRLLRELAAGRHCAVLRRLVVVVLPVQNPDGVAAGLRANANGFDLNRDWFAATQPETPGKLALLQRLPPLALADQHEQDGTGFFFPPNADPIHHEVPAQPLAAIADVLAPALARAFDRRGLDHSSHRPFDLFFMGYGDSVATTLHGAAGMTFEKGGASPYPERVREHALAARTLLRTLARRRDGLLRRWAASWRQARREGERGALQPNAAVQGDARVAVEVPRRPVHAYLLRADRHGADAAALVARLRAAGVEVGRLARDVTLPRFRAYGAPSAGPATLPAGTWVVSLAQTRKHWVQAMLGQDAFVPVRPYGDVSAWSNPLLMGLDGGWTETPPPAGAVARAADEPPPAPAAAPAHAFEGDSVGGLGLALDLLRAGATVLREPRTGVLHVTRAAPETLAALAAERRVAVQPSAGAPEGAVALRAPRVALLADLAPRRPGPAGQEDSARHESHGWTRWVLAERLGLPVEVVTPAQLAAGALGERGISALVVADGNLPAGGLPAAASEAIRAFVEGGGTYVGVRALGLTVAQQAGITAVAARTTPPGFRVAGAALAVTIDGDDPVGWGLGGDGAQYVAGDPVLEPVGARAVVRFPAAVSALSGYVADPAPLAGSAAVTHQTRGAGRVVLFASDPSYRGYVEAGQRLLANALLAPPAAG